MSLAYYPSTVIQNTMASALLLTSIVAFITAYKCHKLQVPLNYHLLHAICLAIYGFAIILYSESVESFLNISAFFILYYGISEIIFGLQLLMLKASVSFKIIAIRLVVGLIIGFGAVLILTTSFHSQIGAILGEGVVFIIMGLNLLISKTVLRQLEVPKIVDFRINNNYGNKYQ
jgi:hypothetical protein